MCDYVTNFDQCGHTHTPAHRPWLRHWIYALCNNPRIGHTIHVVLCGKTALLQELLHAAYRLLAQSISAFSVHGVSHGKKSMICTLYIMT